MQNNKNKFCFDGKHLENIKSKFEEKTGVRLEQKIKRPFLRRPAFATAVVAALIMCAIFGNMLINPSTDTNIFTLKAYAIQPQDDGSIELREVDLVGETYYWSTYSDGNVFYANANLKCEGENIKSVEFFADNGFFFAKQYLKTENGKVVSEDGVLASYRKLPDGGDYALVLYGEEFDVIGSHVTLDKDTMTDNFLLFLGTEISIGQEPPSQMAVRAIATFNDGKTKEETITLNMHPAGSAGIGKMTDDELKKFQAEQEKYQELLRRIPLEQCEVMLGSIQTLAYGDIFEYSLDSSDVVIYHPITKESIDAAKNQGLLDESGIFRQSSNLPDDGSDGYIAVIETDGDGTVVGKVYIVSGWVILKNMK
ncbi:MAG: hypothetical protein FWH48_03250 [Oscillospiraceae bacterium]|nr:hypothetical protein [Oscillospiraceae bacterium]